MKKMEELKMAVDTRKVALIGCGFVGSASAFAIMQSGLFSEMVLIDANTEKAEGEALDIAHGLSYAKPMQIYAGKYDLREQIRSPERPDSTLLRKTSRSSDP